MSILQPGKREVVGDLATLGTKYRVNIPVVSIDDKYYGVSFYTKATHVVDLNERIAVFLGVLASDQERTIFVESSTDTIDIMSLAYRNQRIERLKDSIS